MKWWTADEAVGAHIRMLYMDGGSPSTAPRRTT